ncbi:hypothetical protein FT663_02203 [Candidozyma haemuli var. vulneris]|nr:hypothetical protein FT662_02402 [[Candida] haemuloni var. vulneris]KAF3992690.1 hypothetical protein FT663_02203 [[Candida] haemuloni var. vulneris]
MFTFTTVCHKTSDTQHPLVMLQTREGSRFLFGKVPEGAQRTLNENSMRLGKLKSVFMTGTLEHWSEIGGLPGLFLTTSDATSRGLDVYTNSNKVLSYIVATWRYFVFRKGIELNIAEPQEGQAIGDSAVVLQPVRIQSDEPQKSVSQEVVATFQRQLSKITSLMFPRDVSQVNSDDPDSYKSDPSETEAQTHVSLPDPSETLNVRDQDSLSYIVRMLPVRGKFNPQRAKELGVKPGVDFRSLTQGKRVQTSDGNWVEPDEVLEPPHHFPKTLILDIPNQHYLQNTLSSDKWFQKSDTYGQEDIGLVYHFLGDDIDFSMKEYTDFISKFPPDCKHVICHSKVCDNSLVFLTSTVHHIKLKCFMNDNFSLPYSDTKAPSSNPNVLKLQSLQSFVVSPSKIEVDESNVSSETSASLYQKHIAGTEIDVNFDTLAQKETISLAPVENTTSVKDHAQVFTLGTGSALPSIHRNVLSNLIRVPYVDSNTGEIRFNSIILDGGENTLGTMMRMFGHNNGEQYHHILRELKLIYLSHLHADHHLGLVSIIRAWFEVNKDKDSKLYLLLPWQFDHFLNEWFKLENNFADIDTNRIVYLSNEVFNSRREAEFQQSDIETFEKLYDAGQLNSSIPRKDMGMLPHERVRELYEALNLSKVETVRAIHCYWAYSVSMTFNVSNDETFKISFSGDTRSNPAFYRIGQGTDLLIHEASLDDDLIEEALAKKHTTTTEAVRMAQLMRCPKVLLTHYSTRNSERPTFIRNDQEYQRQCTMLDKYLGDVIENIVTHRVDSDFGFDDMQICYAYDTMSVRYKSFDFQKPFFDKITSLSPYEESERQEKDRLRMMDKRQQKREKRLQYKKMKVQNRS